jgi:6-pyruvoyltetrahydropterin/6-carboxytetrahydropterin synthase
LYKLNIESHFDAAHALRGYKGRCEKTHGHRFRVVAHFTAQRTDQIGLACDFTDLKKSLNGVLARFDHTDLSLTPPFDVTNPSSENIAATVYVLLKQDAMGLPAELYSVEVWESPDAGVEYRPEA